MAPRERKGFGARQSAGPILRRQIEFRTCFINQMGLGLEHNSSGLEEPSAGWTLRCQKDHVAGLSHFEVTKHRKACELIVDKAPSQTLALTALRISAAMFGE